MLPALKHFPAMLALTALGAHVALAKTDGPPHEVTIHSIIVHAISGPRCDGDKVVFSGAEGDADTWKEFFDKHPLLGIHYIVDRAGKVVASMPEDRVANHALGNNKGTIGIELVHSGDGKEPFGDSQIDALVDLIRSIRGRHDIPVASIKGHSDVDSRTFVCGGASVKSRSDPGENFPWDRVRSAVAARGG